MERWCRLELARLVLAIFLFPVPVFAQSTKAGIVTTLEGNVTAVRAVAPGPVPLKFRDDVFLHDRVVTGDQSFARLLLGGKAVVTIRERSAVTITEVPGRSTVEIESGKIALSVARDRMLPGEVINIKTPNAVAGVRGTVVVAEVDHRPGPGGGALQPFTRLWVLRGVVDATIHSRRAPRPAGAVESSGVVQRRPVDVDERLVHAGAGRHDRAGPSATAVPDPDDASQGPARLEAVNGALSLLTSLTGQQLVAGIPQRHHDPDRHDAKQTVTEVMDTTSSPTALGTTPFQPTFNMITPQSVVMITPQGVVGPQNGPSDRDVRRPPGSRDPGRPTYGRTLRHR